MKTHVLRVIIESPTEYKVQLSILNSVANAIRAVPPWRLETSEGQVRTKE